MLAARSFQGASVKLPSAYAVRFRSQTTGGGARKRLAKLLRQKRTSYKSDDVEIPAARAEVARSSVDFLQRDPDLRTMIDEAKERIHARFIEPNKYWKNSLNMESTQVDDVRRELSKKFGPPRSAIEPIDVFSSPLDVGDLVELGSSLENSGLCCVVELPASIDDPRYTFVNSYGDLIFASKSKIKLRFPRVYPSAWFTDFVLDEKLFNLSKRGIKQIGKPKFLTENLALTNFNRSVFEQALINNGHNLKHLDTFIIPSLPSQLMAKDLSQIVSNAWDLLPTYNSKLELVHNLLQDPDSPVPIGIFQLYNALQAIDLEATEKRIVSAKTYDDLIDYYSQLSKEISAKISQQDNYDESPLGKQLLGKFDIFSPVDISSFYAMTLALKKNDKLFTGVTKPDYSTQFPLYVTVQSLAKIVQLDVAIEDFRGEPAKLNGLVNYIVSKMECLALGDSKGLSKLKKPEHYDTVIDLMKVYCSSSTIIDPITESFLLKIFRNVPEYNDSTITSTLVYETLVRLGESSEVQTPVEWTVDLQKPYTGVSEKANLEQNYYNALTEYQHSAIDDSVDHCSKIRQDFTTDVVYCVDDKSAFEIDDGISVERLSSGLIRVNTYVADVASYLSPSDTVAKIAFERASTVYFPDDKTAPVEMLPNSVVKKVELRPGAPVRAMRFSFLFDPDTKSFIDNSMEINPAFVSRLLNITYDEVNAILNGDAHVLEKLSDKFQIPAEVLSSDLTALMGVSSDLNKSRTSVNRFSFKFANQLSGVTRSDNDDQSTLTFQEDSFSKAQTLVSEIMIHTNALVARFLKANRIPSIYRVLRKTPVSETVKNQIDSLDKSSMRDTPKAANFLSGTSFSVYPLDHDYIGLGPYCTVTSPLRRFQDLATHWQLQSFLKLQHESQETDEVFSYDGNLMFTESNMAHILTHVASRNFQLKQVSNKSKNFFIFKKLSELSDTKTTFRVMIVSRPSSNGEVEGMLLEYGGVKCLLKSSTVFSNKKVIKDYEEATLQNFNSFSTVKIGDIIEDCQITGIELLSGDLTLTSTKF